MKAAGSPRATIPSAMSSPRKEKPADIVSATRVQRLRSNVRVQDRSAVGQRAR
jgi:hypothetical protein